MKAGLTRILICLLGVANIATPHVSAQASASFTLQPNQQDSTVLEIDNKCKQPESFSITKSPDNSMSSWIQPAQNFVSDVPSGGSKSVTINYSSEGLAAGATRTAGLVVKCASCSGNCTSITDQKFTVLLNVISAGGGSGSGSGPTGNPAGGTNPQGAGNPSGNPTNNPTNPGGPGTTNPQTPGSGATSKPTGHSSSDGAVSNPGIPGTTTPSGSTPNGSDNPSTTPQSTVPSGSDSSVP